MRLLRLVHSLSPSTGGVAEALRQFGMLAQTQGCDLTVVTLDAPSDPWLAEFTFEIVALGPCHNRYGYTPKLAPWLRANALSFDAAIIDGLWQYHGWAAYRALKGKIPYYIMPHGMLDPWFRKHYPLKHLKKWLYWPWAEYRILRDAKGVIFTAEDERRKARESFWLYRVNHEIVAPLGIMKPTYNEDLGRALFQQTVPGLRNEPYVLFMGRLHEKKGVDILIRAYRNLESSFNTLPFHLVLAGPDSDKDYTMMLEKMANGCKRIHFAGMLKGDPKWTALADAEAMILPSHQENFGLVVIEALAMGTPVLLTTQVNIWREISNAGAGIVESDDDEGILALLRSVMETSPTIKEGMRKNATQCFKAHYAGEQSTVNLIKNLK